jgi:DNA polymerase III epsilon subunit-like protein
VLQVTALHVHRGGVLERFTAMLNPGRRVPRYVLARAGIEADVLQELPPFEAIFDDLERFLGQRPICAQEAQQCWAFLRAEARRLGRALAEPLLLDVNDLAVRLLKLPGKPTLSLVARRLDVGFTRLEQADEEARVVGLVVQALLHRAAETGLRELGQLQHAASSMAALRRRSTLADLPNDPGVYVMRDSSEETLYVGKARRLKERVGAYVHRPLGATRRLEGLTSAVHGVDIRTCETDLEALVLEDQEIRRLQPRFNTARQQGLPRLWLRLPPQPLDAKRAPARIKLASGPEAGAGDYLGPFRNEALAEHVRLLANDVFELRRWRQHDRVRYVEELGHAWTFLNGSTEVALAEARRQHARGVASGDLDAARAWEKRLGAVRDYDVARLLLPADPRHSRYAVVRPGLRGLEGFLIHHAVLSGFHRLEDDDCEAFARALLARQQARTGADEVHVVLRWLGAQRPTAWLLALPDDEVRAADLIANAAATLLAD